MKLTNALISFASLASISSAAALPQSSTGTSDWWYWTVTNLTITSTPAAPASNYQFFVQYFGQATKANCSGVAEAIKCSDSAYTVTAKEGKPFTITQKLYQTGAVAVLSGNTMLKTSCIAIDGVTTEFTKTVCSAPEFKVDAYLVDTILP